MFWIPSSIDFVPKKTNENTLKIHLIIFYYKNTYLQALPLRAIIKILKYKNILAHNLHWITKMSKQNELLLSFSKNIKTINKSMPWKMKLWNFFLSFTEFFSFSLEKKFGILFHSRVIKSHAVIVFLSRISIRHLRATLLLEIDGLSTKNFDTKNKLIWYF